MTSITNEEKRDFLKHFLDNYALRNSVCRWLLAFLRDNLDHLDKIHFVDSIHGYYQAMVISTKCVEDAEYVGVIDGGKSYDIEKMFNLVRFNEEKDYYIELRFKDRMKNEQFLGVLEDNNKRGHKISVSDKVMIDSLLKHSIESNVQNLLMLLIDEALVTGNKERFNELSQQFKEMNLK